MLYLFDLLGTFAFAVYGAHVAIKKEFDVFGIFVAALLTAFGGGTLRSMLLGGLPAYFSDNAYIVAVGVGVVFAIVFFDALPRLAKTMLVIDAVGLVTFAFIGAATASHHGLGAFGVVSLATLTAVGGGVLRDIALRETPQIFYSDFYASPAIILGLGYVALDLGQAVDPKACALLAACFAIRLLAIKYGIKLWKPREGRPAS